MVAAIGLWNIALTLVVCGGISVICAVIGACVLVVVREERNRPVIPWGARMRVERAKAHSAILEEHLRQDATEIKRLALDHQRDQVLAAIKEQDTERVMALGLPRGEY